MKFVLVGYGMAESPAREEHLEACHALRTQGFGEDDLRKLDEVVAAAEAVLQSDLEAGWDRLDALEEKYEDAPWMAVLKDQGGITGGFLKYPHALIKVYMKRKLGMKDSWFFDSRPLLRTTEIPMLWLLGGQDLEAPNEVTITELQRLHAQGRPIELIIFANADHGILDRARGEEQRACLHPLRAGVLPGRKGMVVAADGPACGGQPAPLGHQHGDLRGGARPDGQAWPVGLAYLRLLLGSSQVPLQSSIHHQPQASLITSQPVVSSQP